MDINLPQDFSGNNSNPQFHSTTTQTQVTQKPVDKAERISTVDMIRGVALCGILLMNIPGFGIHWSAFDRMIRGPQNTADFYTMEVISVFFEGTMRGLFSMLFGAGMLLFTMNKKETLGGPSVAELYYRRLLLLVAFGVFNAYILLWQGDILFFYGLCGMLLYPFRKTAAKWLFALGILWICFNMIKGQINYNETRDKRAAYNEAVQAKKEGKPLTDEQKSAKAEWLQRENWRPDSMEVQRDISKVRGSYATVFNYYLPRNSGGEIWGTYHWAFWDCVAMMLIGMAFFRWGYFSNKPRTSTYIMGLLVGYGIGIPIGYIMFSKGMIEGTLHQGLYVDAYTVNHQTLYDVKRFFLCLGHASLIMLVFRSNLLNWLMKGLANVGQMAFTNYLMQSIICTLIFHGYGLGFYNKLQFHQLYYVVGGVWIFQLITSSIWLKYYRFGPFEWLWRSMTYWKKQPMRLK